jgi:UTP--glucose-1-phosphate uridylyltransferase
VPKYGVADVSDGNMDGSSFSVADFVEKPSQDAAPSNLAITGRYVFTPEIFDYLEETEPGVGGELQLTDAIRKLSDVRGVELDGSRYDIGNIPSWLQANIEMAINHDDGEMNTAVKSLIQEYAQ